MNRERIAAALEALSQRSNDDAFVILLDLRTERFVQFSGGAGRELLLDLPSQTLDRDETLRAAVYFRELGLELEDYEVYDRPGGRVVGRQRSFQRELGKDVEAATEMALQIFQRVYLLPREFELVIEEN